MYNIPQKIFGFEGILLKMTTNEKHPWQHYVPPLSSVLLIGTFPPIKKRWSYDFFYPNKANLFWPILSNIAKQDLLHFEGTAAVEERKEILQQLRVGITDMGLHIQRLHNSSLDENIEALEYMDIFEILRAHPTINKLLFTSSSGKSSAAKWFVNYLQTKHIFHRFPSGPKPLRSTFTFEGRNIDLVILFSPSRRAANRMSLEQITNMYEGEIVPNEKRQKQ